MGGCMCGGLHVCVCGGGGGLHVWVCACVRVCAHVCVCGCGYWCGCKQVHTTKNHNYYERCYKKWNEQDFLDDLSIQNWNTNQDNVSDSYNDFIWHLKGCSDRHAPLKKTSKKEIKLKSKPWITPYIVTKIKHRNAIC